MQQKRTPWIFSLIILLGIGANRVTLADTVTTSTATKSNAETYLFVQSAGQAQLTPVDVKKGTYQLTLNNVQPYLNYVSDHRAAHSKGLLPTEKFMQAWQQNKAQSLQKPKTSINENAITLHGVVDGKITTFAVQLSNPQFDAKTNSVTYAVNLIRSANQLSLTKQVTLQNVAVYMDDNEWCPGCCCG